MFHVFDRYRIHDAVCVHSPSVCRAISGAVAEGEEFVDVLGGFSYVVHPNGCVTNWR